MPDDSDAGPGSSGLRAPQQLSGFLPRIQRSLFHSVVASTPLSCLPGCSDSQNCLPLTGAPQRRKKSTGRNQHWMQEGKVRGTGCGAAGVAGQELPWGPPLGKEAGLKLWVGQGEELPQPPLWSAGQDGLSLLSTVWLGRGYSPGGCMWGVQRLRGAKAQILILAWRKPIPSATLWLAGQVGRGAARPRAGPAAALVVGFLGWGSRIRPLGWARGKDETGAFVLNILLGRVSRRNRMTCSRRERREVKAGL